MKKFIIFLLLLSLFSFSKAQKLKKLGIEFETTSYNFGDIQMWENQPAIFTLKNNSKHAISILPLFSENDLEIIYPERSIAPGETAIIKAIYYTSGTGSFSRKFPIYFNTSPEAYELKITGNIKSLSPTAYIQCPMAKPEHSKPKVELAGNVAEIETEIPLSGSIIHISGVSNKTSLTFYADKNGNFGSKLPTGNYQITVEHPNYTSHSSFFFLGQNSGHLKVRLAPNLPEPVLATNTQPSTTPLPKNTIETITTKQDGLNTTIGNNLPSKVANPSPNELDIKPDLAQEEISTINGSLSNSIPKDEPRKTETIRIDEKLPPPDNEPRENITQNENGNTHIEQNPVPTTSNEAAPIATKQPQSIPPVTAERYTPPPPKQKTYTIKVLDEVTFAVIDEAQVYITPLLNKKQVLKFKSDGAGMVSTPLAKEEYKVIVNADNYISGETIIHANQSEEIIRVFLSPVSNLFEDIYKAKKAASEPNDLLNQLSFGKTEFTFADRAPNNNEPEVVPPTATTNLATETPTARPTASQVTEIPEEEIIEIAQAIATNTPTNNIEEVPAQAVVDTPVPEVIVATPTNNGPDLDSIQTLFAKLQEEKLAMEIALAQANSTLNEQEDLLELKENEISKKDQELSNKLNELEIVKTDYEVSQEKLNQQKQALENIEKTSTPVAAKVSEDVVLSKNDYAANNVLFLIDVSSSMGKENKMELLKESIKNLTMVLRDIDRVAIIAYNQKTNVILESVSGDNKETILAAIDSLETSGLTYGVNGLQTAYDLIEYYYIGDGNNQIILATDGLFSSVNVTMTENELNKEVRKQASNSGIKLSVIGFGQDKEGAKLMEKLANNGEGQFIQIKNPWEAKTVLIEEIKLNSKRTY